VRELPADCGRTCYPNELLWRRSGEGRGNACMSAKDDLGGLPQRKGISVHEHGNNDSVD